MFNTLIELGFVVTSVACIAIWPAMLIVLPVAVLRAMREE